MATISSSQRSLLDRLAKSIEFRGVWVPFTDVSGNVYRIRANKNDGTWVDVVVLGANKIRRGNWNMPICPEAVKTIKQVVVESGGRLPDNDIVFELLNQRQRNVPTEREIQGSSDGESAGPGKEKCQDESSVPFYVQAAPCAMNSPTLSVMRRPRSASIRRSSSLRNASTRAGVMRSGALGKDST